ncbi:hypothetical protein [Bacillus sp. B-jedd]|uniref:hypothetical protein n=1 Tax=Bacillus sp. B-jedd TaxID=1476857 RepID=UPI0005155EAC|nr:hypothetical protein [Bacillus sp. B-jedd]CEG27247.1 hypothetical protein BN1002_02103 [Bacillus sp. B-jedd]
MKKYILPIGILIISVFFLNQFIEPKEEKKAIPTEAKTFPVPEIISPMERGKAILLSKGDSERRLTKSEIVKAGKEVKELEVHPYYMMTVSFFAAEKPEMKVTEWDPEKGEEYAPDSQEFFGFVKPGFKTLIIRAKWQDGTSAIYMAKIRVKKEYSYQDVLSPNLDEYTVMGIFDSSEPGDEAMPESKIGLYRTTSLHLFGGANDLKNTYPELESKKLPTYYIFYQGKVIFAAENYEELNQYLTRDKNLLYKGESENWAATLAVRQKLGNGNLRLTVRYHKNDQKPLEPFTFIIDGPGVRAEGTLELNESGMGEMDLPMHVQLSEKDKITCTISWEGKEETITLDVK